MLVIAGFEVIIILLVGWTAVSGVNDTGHLLL